MRKKKKHIQTEKERLFQEDAARKRKDIAEAKRSKRIKDAWWLVGIACILIALSLGFTVWTVARMHNFETNYIAAVGTVSDYEVSHRTATSGNYSRTRYFLVISYTFEGRMYKFTDTVAYRTRPTDLIGTTTEIYVNPKNPEQTKKVTTADDPSIVSAISFPFGAVFYALGTLLLLQEKGNSLVKRLFRIHLPVFLWCVASVLLFWIGLPNDGFGAVFSRVEGAIGYTVVAGIALLTFLIDVIISKKK
ncbi:MAG: DUF3592 domain-containing protein [Clostridia bacterium]|nr:DUF3592 domain-containing protein [Clostridia bacterium]